MKNLLEKLIQTSLICFTLLCIPLSYHYQFVKGWHSLYDRFSQVLFNSGLKFPFIIIGMIFIISCVGFYIIESKEN